MGRAAPHGVSEPSCHVQAVYDFDGSNAMRGRRSRGTGIHDLVVGFAADRAVITSESSRELGGRGTVARRSR